MTKRPYTKFFHQDWCSDGEVGRMTMEEIGTYWSLLVRQMIDGYVPVDPEDLMYDLHTRSLDEVNRLLTPRVLKKFEKFSDNQTRQFNQRLMDVITETDQAQQRSSENVSKRWSKPVTASSLESATEDQPVFDFGPITRAMPRRRKNGRVEGWDGGLALLKYISTQEEYDERLAAVKNYARERHGQDPEFHISFNNFMKSEWVRFIPAGYKPAGALAPKVEKKVEAVAEYKNTHERYLALVKQGKRIGDPPWVAGNFDDEETKATRAAMTEEQRAKWLNDYLENPNQF